MAHQVTGLVPLIQVFDMAAALRFYRDTLHFVVVQHSPEVEGPEGRYFHWAWLRLGGAELMLNTAYDTGERPAAPDPARMAAHGDTCLYIGCPDVDGLYALLSGRGLSLDPPHTAPYGMRQLNLRDPDGYMLCFQHPAN